MAITLIFTALFAALALAVPVENEITPVATLQLMAEGQREMNEFVRTFTATLGEEGMRNASYLSSSSAACEPAALIFARGTFEPAGEANLGFVVGMPFSSELKKVIPGFGAVGVDYNNGVAGYLSGGDAAGAKTMAKMIEQKASQCPETKIIASGYSQGAQLTHLALKQVGGAAKQKVAGVVVFGDPYKGQAIPGVDKGKIYTNCAGSDPICAGVPCPCGSHLTYGSDTAELNKCVAFVKSKV